MPSTLLVPPRSVARTSSAPQPPPTVTGRASAGAGGYGRREMGEDGQYGVATRRPYPGLSGVVKAIIASIVEFRGAPAIRAFAVGLAQDALPPTHATGMPELRDFDAIAHAVYAYLVRNVQYVRDPYGVEMLQSPAVTLRVRAGDCDDHTTLGGALLASLGVPVRVRVVGKGRTPSHVFLEYKGSAGWTAFDTTIAQAPGALAARAFAFDKIYAVESGGGIGSPDGDDDEGEDIDIGLTSAPIYAEDDGGPRRGGDDWTPGGDRLTGGAVTGSMPPDYWAPPGYVPPVVDYPSPPQRETGPPVAPPSPPPSGPLIGPPPSTPPGVVQTFGPPTGAPAQRVTPGTVIDTIADVLGRASDVATRVRDGYKTAADGGPPPPVQQQQAGALGSIPVVPLALGAGLLVFFVRRRSAPSDRA